MIFRDFVEETKDAVKLLAGGVTGGRDITPMVHLETEDAGRELIAVDPAFFEDTDRKTELVESFIVPLIQERMAMKVAWTFTTTQRVVAGFGAGAPASGSELRFVTAVVMDREVCEVWLAPLLPHVGEWLLLPPNNTEGLLVGPVQEALR